jgi:hypothetical protein
MLLHVQYIDDRYDYVKDIMLDALIGSRKIAKFHRRTGWVTLGVDPIRVRDNKHSFKGIERRSAISSLYTIDIKVI